MVQAQQLSHICDNSSSWQRHLQESRRQQLFMATSSPGKQKTTAAIEMSLNLVSDDMAVFRIIFVIAR